MAAVGGYFEYFTGSPSLARAMRKYFRFYSWPWVLAASPERAVCYGNQVRACTNIYISINISKSPFRQWQPSFPKPDNLPPTALRLLWVGTPIIHRDPKPGTGYAAHVRSYSWPWVPPAPPLDTAAHYFITVYNNIYKNL